MVLNVPEELHTYVDNVPEVTEAFSSATKEINDLYIGLDEVATLTLLAATRVRNDANFLLACVTTEITNLQCDWYAVSGNTVATEEVKSAELARIGRVQGHAEDLEARVKTVRDVAEVVVQACRGVIEKVVRLQQLNIVYAGTFFRMVTFHKTMSEYLTEIISEDQLQSGLVSSALSDRALNDYGDLANLTLEELRELGIDVVIPPSQDISVLLGGRWDVDFEIDPNEETNLRDHFDEITAPDTTEPVGPFSPYAYSTTPEPTELYDPADPFGLTTGDTAYSQFRFDIRDAIYSYNNGISMGYTLFLLPNIDDVIERYGLDVVQDAQGRIITVNGIAVSNINPRLSSIFGPYSQNGG